MITKPRHPLAPDLLEPKVYARVFESGEGALILEELVRVFNKPAVLSGGIDAVLQTYDRNGARKVLDFILQKINRANGVPDDDDQ